MELAIKKMKIFLKYLKDWAKALKKEVAVLYIAYKRPDVPFIAKLVAGIVVGYALSPIDLIPDFIPVIGYLDDLILVPLGIALAIRLIPKEILKECREEAVNLFKDGKPYSLIAGVFIGLIWILFILFVILKLLKCL